jgi:uncharacterized protein DUF4124
MRILLAVACLAIASAAAGETIYKYRGANGRLIYSNKPVPGATLIESFERKASPPVTPQGPSESDLQGEDRIRQRLTAMDAAWKEVQDSGRALAEALARLAAGAAPEGGESRGIAESSAAPEAGGPFPAATPAVGGRMSPGRGRGESPEYAARVVALEGAVKAARARNEAAWRVYNELR